MKRLFEMFTYHCIQYFQTEVQQLEIMKNSLYNKCCLLASRSNMAVPECGNGMYILKLLCFPFDIHMRLV